MSPGKAPCGFASTDSTQAACTCCGVTPDCGRKYWNVSVHAGLLIFAQSTAPRRGCAAGTKTRLLLSEGSAPASVINLRNASNVTDMPIDMRAILPLGSGLPLASKG